MPCPHNRQRSQCRDCGGVGICPHNRVRSTCKDCGGTSRCVHGKMKIYCRECGGSGFCAHGRRKNICKDCGGKLICPHGRQRAACKDCQGSGICHHGDRRNQCTDCGGSCVSKRLAKLGWTLEDYRSAEKNQNGLCAICGRKARMGKGRLAADHDHLTGKRRQLLCSPCNVALGLFEDSQESLKSALRYLDFHS